MKLDSPCIPEKRRRLVAGTVRRDALPHAPSLRNTCGRAARRQLFRVSPGPVRVRRGLSFPFISRREGQGVARNRAFPATDLSSPGASRRQRKMRLWRGLGLPREWGSRPFKQGAGLSRDPALRPGATPT